MNEIQLFLSILITGFSLLLVIISLASFYRIRKIKLFIVSLAFLAFLIKGLLLIISIMSQEELALIVDFIILLLLYLAVVKK